MVNGEDGCHGLPAVPIAREEHKNDADYAMIHPPKLEAFFAKAMMLK